MEEKKETVSVSGVVSEEMLQKFMAYHIKAINKVVMPVVLSAFFLLVWLFVNVNWIVSLILTVILWGIANWMLAKSIKSRAPKEYNSNRQIRNEVFLTIDEEGIRQKRHNSETFWEWDDVILIDEKSDLFLFYVSKNTAILLPKNFMVKHELTKLREIIQNNALTQKVKLLEEAV